MELTNRTEGPDAPSSIDIDQMMLLCLKKRLRHLKSPVD